MGCDKKEKPLSEIKILKAIVFTNPIPEADDLLEQFIRSNMQQRIAAGKLKAVSSVNNASGSGSGSSSSGAQAKFSDGTVDGSNKIRKLT